MPVEAGAWSERFSQMHTYMLMCLNCSDSWCPESAPLLECMSCSEQDSLLKAILFMSQSWKLNPCLQACSTLIMTKGNTNAGTRLIPHEPALSGCSFWSQITTGEFQLFANVPGFLFSSPLCKSRSAGTSIKRAVTGSPIRFTQFKKGAFSMEMGSIFSDLTGSQKNPDVIM